MIKKTRLNAVSYLNTKPLTYALERRIINHNFEILYDVPSVCARQVRTGEAAAGVIPSIEYARNLTSYFIVPDVAIVSAGPVGSIFLFHRVPIHRIKRIAMDESSRTSVALARIILNEKYCLNFSTINHQPNITSMLELADAALVIGDPALENFNRPEPRIDLGEIWQEMTGLPFVYAFWAGKEKALSLKEIKSLIQAKNYGINCLSEIANSHAYNHSLPGSFYSEYLTERLTYNFGNLEQKGLLEFYRLAQTHGLINNIPELLFYTC